MNRNVLETPMPGIFEVNARAAACRQAGATLINLGQAVPFFGPPDYAVQAWRRHLESTALHRYSPDPGLPGLRNAWASLLGTLDGRPVDPEREMLITAGANGAYLTAVLALLDPGDRMGLLTPFYFNHAMAVRMAGGEVVEIPVRAADGYQPDPDEVLRIAVDQGLKAVTLVNPNNPTGATWTPERVWAMAKGLTDRGILVVSDETYRFFPDPHIEFQAAGGVEAHPERVVTIGSFSKTFGITGWRVGYLTAAAPLIAQMVKVHDTMVICAPTPGQRLVQTCLEGPWEAWLADRRADLDWRMGMVRKAGPVLGAWRVGVVGRFFAWLDGPGPQGDLDAERALLAAGASQATGGPAGSPTPGSGAGPRPTLARAMVDRLMDTQGLVLIPGDIFGRGWDRSLRLSLGGTSGEDLAEGLQRLQLGLSG